MKIEKIKELPKEMTIGYLECVIMPNGEAITGGKSLGFIKWDDDEKKNYVFAEKKEE